jgi:hypothetical protein
MPNYKKTSLDKLNKSLEWIFQERLEFRQRVNIMREKYIDDSDINDITITTKGFITYLIKHGKN